MTELSHPLVLRLFMSNTEGCVTIIRKKHYFCHQNNQFKMGNAESIKLHLISQIASLNDDTVLAQLENVLTQNHSNNEDKILRKLNTPRKKKLDIELLKKEQNFTQFNRTRFDQLIKELNIQEPIEQLLQMI